MIKCPNCSAMSEDGALFCDQCVWDLTGVAPEPSAAPAPAAEPVALAAEPIAEAIEAAPAEMAVAIDVEAVPAAEAIPAIDVALAEETLTATTPMDAPPVAVMEADVVLGDLAAFDPGMPLAAPLSSATLDAGLPPPAAVPVSAVRPPTAIPPAAPPKAVSAVRPPTAIPPAPPVSAGRPPTGVSTPTTPISAVRPPTAVKPPSVLAPKSPSLAPNPTVARIAPLAVAKLVAVRGLRTNLDYPIYDGPNFIGRSGDSPVDIDLTDQETEEKTWSSRQHACVTGEGSNLYVEDLNSANGTWVNKVRLNPGEKKQLRNGDFIQTGTVMFVVKH